MILFRKQSFLFHAKVILILNYLFDTLTGNGLQEIWVQTTNNYIYLNKYQLTFSQDQQLNISLRTITSDCSLTGFVYLLPPPGQDSSDSDALYNILIGLYPDEIGVRFLYRNQPRQYKTIQYGPKPASCEDFRDFDFRISWNNQELSIFNSFNSTSFTFDHQLTSFQVQDIAVGDYYRDAVWRIKHSGVFTGYNCAKEDTYGAMDLLTSTTRSEIMCAAMCGKTEECLGMNYNDQTKQCELIRSGQLVVMEPRQGWKFSTKCLNGKEMCLACL